MLNLVNWLPTSVAALFRKRESEPVQQSAPESCQYQGVRKMPLASSIGARHKGCEISGHWTIRGQEVFLDYKRKAPEARNNPEISQSISKAELKGYQQ